MHVEDYITTVGKQHRNERQNYEFRSISTLREFIEGAIKNCTIPDVSGSVYLTENQIAELAQIGSEHLYLGVMDEGRISYGGIMEILKRYEKLRKTDR